MPNSVVSEYAQKLAERLVEEGPLSKDDIRTWLADEQLEARTVNLVFGQGKKKWHEESGYLVANAPGSAGGPAPEQIDPMAMESPQEVFEAMTVNLGVPERPAATAAFFCFQNYDMSNPRQAWEAIRSTQITPILKRPVWKTWLTYSNVDAPPELIAEVEQSLRPGMSAPTVEKPAVVPGRRFVAVNGDVVPTDTEDGGGMSFGEACRSAQLQLEKMQMGNQDPEQPLMVQLLHESGETQRAMMAQNNNHSDGGTALVMVEMNSQRSETQLRFEQAEERRRHDVELSNIREEARWKESQEREDRRNKEFTQTLQLLVQQKPTNPFSALDEIMPGFGKKILDSVMNPPAALMNTPNGNMSVADYERIENINMKKDTVKLVKDNLPELWQVAQDLAQATDRAYDKFQGKEEPAKEETQSRGESETQTDPPYNAYCASCLRVLFVPSDAKKFACNHCGAAQTAAGELLPEENVDINAPVVEADSYTMEEDSQPPDDDMRSWNPYRFDVVGEKPPVLEDMVEQVRAPVEKVEEVVPLEDLPAESIAAEAESRAVSQEDLLAAESREYAAQTAE